MNPIEMLKADVRKIDQEFLDKFKDLQGLWDPTHEEYCNKYHRTDNLKKLLPILQKLKPNATIIDVKTKINTFRTNYRKEFNRIKNFILSNPDKKDFMKPRLWYFKSLLFLNTIKSKHNPDEANELVDINFTETSSETDENSDEKEPVSTSQMEPHISPVHTELTTAFSSFNPKPVCIESDEDKADPSNVDDQIESCKRTGSTDDVEIEPMKDPTMIMECEKKFLITFRKLPGLWNPSDPYYTNRISRNVDLKKLLPFLKKINPKATVNDVRKKINTFRSNYRRELKKIEHYKSTNTDPDFVYKPKLWYYKYMSFLNDLEDLKEREEQITEDEASDNENTHLEAHSPTSFTLTKKSKKRKHSENKTSEESEKAKLFLVKEDQQIDSKWEESSSVSKRKLQKTKEHKVNVPETAGQFSINQDPQKIQNPIVFEWDETLSRLESKQRLFAKKAINDILYEAELGNLHAGSVKINQSSFYQFDQPSSSSQFDQRMRAGENVILVKMEGGDPLS